MTETPTELPDGVVRWDHSAYNGKHYLLPIFDTAGAIVLRPDPARATIPASPDGLVIAGIHRPFDIRELLRPRRPASLGLLDAAELARFARPGSPRVLDMPIKLPDLAEYRLPRALAQFAPTLQRIVDVEHLINPHHADYHAYLTVDQGTVEPDELQREAPCHVDGFQGARWHPRCFTNHSYTVSDVLPTAYYVQPFDLLALDETKHDFFWELNAQVADTNEAHRWQPEAAELTVMDCYCVHRGVEARVPARLELLDAARRSKSAGASSIASATPTTRSCSTRWPMVRRDIEQLHLRAFRRARRPVAQRVPVASTRWQPAASGAPRRPRLRR